MLKRKILEVYLNQEGENCIVHTKINANIDPCGIITKAEQEQIKDIILNICKRINIKNGDCELKFPS